MTPLGSVPAEKTSKSAPPMPAEHGLGDLAAGAVAGADEEHADGRVGHRTFLPAAAGATRGRDGRLEVDEFAVEAIEVVALAGDRRPLVGDQRRQIAVDLAALEAQPRHPAGVLRAEPEASQADDESQPGQVLVGVLAVAVRAPVAARQDPDRLVPAHRGRCDAGALGEFRDLHARTVHLQVT